MFPAIQLQRVRYLRGPNIWTYRPVLETWLDLGELEQWPSERLPGFNERLIGFLPALVEHHCGVGERGGFMQRLHEGTWLGHVLEHVVIELLNLAGMPTGFGQTRSTSKPGVYRMVFRARDEHVGRAALSQGHALLTAAINGQAFDVQAAIQTVRESLDKWYFGPSTAAIIAAATDRRIPHVRLNDGNLVQFGFGAKSRRIWTAETDATSAIAETIAGDKTLTKTLIGAVGVPVPEGEIVDSADAAWDAAQSLGLPVVVKPSDGNHGRGVALDLDNEADIRAAFDVARQHGSEVIVEKNIPGHEHRLLVVGHKVVAAARGDVANVLADGRSTVLQLVDAQINSDPRRGDSELHPLSLLRLVDDDVLMADLRRQGLAPDSVPAAGRVVLIQRNGNVSVDCTDEVHPDVARVVALAAKTIGLDIAGVDLVAEDISRPLQAQGGAVVEVNAGPGLLMHLKPAEGTPRPVGRAIVDQLFQAADDGRIPVVGVLGSRSTAAIARKLAWVIQLSGLHVGVACRDGVYLDRHNLERVDGTQWEAAERLLMNRSVEAAVFEHTAHGILHDGLPYDRCHLGIVTDMGQVGDLASFDIHSREHMPKVMRTQVDVVLSDGCAVLNGDEADVAALAEHSDGAVVIYGTQLAADQVQAWVDAGHAVVMHRGDSVICCDASGEKTVAKLKPGRSGANTRGSALVDEKSSVLPLTPPQIDLVVVAAGVALKLAPELVNAALNTYEDQQRSEARRIN